MPHESLNESSFPPPHLSQSQSQLQIQPQSQPRSLLAATQKLHTSRRIVRRGGITQEISPAMAPILLESIPPRSRVLNDNELPRVGSFQDS